MWYNQHTVIPNKRVSREHARLHRQGRRLVLTDLGSTNGTFLNDERMLAPVDVRDGDRVSIGDVILTLHDPERAYLETPRPKLEVDVKAGIVRVDQRVVDLSPRESVLVTYLYEQRGEICSRDDIGNTVWPEYGEGIHDYQVENLVRRLRARIEPDPANPQLLLTVRGMGGKLVTREKVD